MSKGTENVVEPGSKPNTVRTPGGKTLTMPADWELLPPGDATMTRRTKAASPAHYVVQQKKGRKVFARGVWAPKAIIDQVKADLEAERATETYAKRKVATAKRRDKVQTEYVEDFTAAVKAFLAFHPRHEQLAEQVAKAVADHATPIGSGTVARTTRISVERRASNAVIAWMRHQTTSYDEMKIARVKGERFKVRKQLARRSKELLALYRRGDDPGETCPLTAGLVPKSAPPKPPAKKRSAKKAAPAKPSMEASSEEGS